MKQKMEMSGKVDSITIEMDGRTIKIHPTKDYIGLKQNGKLICTLGQNGSQLYVGIHHFRNGVPDVQKVMVEDDRAVEDAGLEAGETDARD